MRITHWRNDFEIPRQPEFCRNFHVIEWIEIHTREEMIRITRLTVQAPLLFSAGWLFNFVYDIKFLAGFVSGWMAHSWIGRLFM